MYTYARVCLFGPCYSARVGATLPLVEEGKRKDIQTPSRATHAPSPVEERAHNAETPHPPLRTPAPPLAHPPPRRSRPPPAPRAFPVRRSDARPRRPHSDSECPRVLPYLLNFQRGNGQCGHIARAAAVGPTVAAPQAHANSSLLSAKALALVTKRVLARRAPACADKTRDGGDGDGEVTMTGTMQLESALRVQVAMKSMGLRAD